jgi:dephospho-CoA kinase
MNIDKSKELNDKLIIGIVGLYASGKSTVAEVFVNNGFYEVDVDKYGYEALDKNKEEIIQTFGNKILTDRTIDRKELGKIVFNSKKELTKLNAIVHPYMSKSIEKDIIESEHKKIIIHAALLFDLKLDLICDRIVAVISNIENIYRRGIERDSRNLNQIKFILSNQPTPNQLKENADYIIDNNSTKKAMIDKTKSIIQTILEEQDYV